MNYKQFQEGDHTCSFYNLIVKIEDPPFQLVHDYFQYIGFKKFDEEDKSNWQFYVCFAGVNFRVRNWKLFSWSIDGPIGENDKAMQLKRRILKEIKQYESNVLVPKFLNDKKSCDYYILSSFRRIYGLYNFYSTILEKELGSNFKSPHVIGKPLIDSAFNFDEMRSGNISHFACSMIVFFFSSLESFFDLAYVFYLSEKMSHDNFLKMSWSEKFKKTFSKTKSEVWSQYDFLFQIYEKLRCEIVHGFGRDASFLFKTFENQFVQINYNQKNQQIKIPQLNIRTPLQHGLIIVEEKTAKKCLEIFRDFFLILKNDSVYSCYIHYGLSSFHLPVNRKEANKIVHHMKSESIFLEWLEHELEISERLINGEF